jgi:hypothetical protein
MWRTKSGTSPARLRQARQAQHDGVDAVVQVLAKSPRRDLVPSRSRLVAVMMRTTTLHRASSCRPAVELARLLDRAQELHLHLDRDLADLVEEQRAAVGQLEVTAPLGVDRAGEGARAREPNSSALDERLGDGRAVDRHEGARLSRAVIVQCTRDELLARARVSDNQYRNFLVDEAIHLRQQIPLAPSP